MATNRNSQIAAVETAPVAPTLKAKRYVSKLNKTVCRLSNSQEAWADGNVLTVPNSKLEVTPRVTEQGTFYNIWVIE